MKICYTNVLISTHVFMFAQNKGMDMISLEGKTNFFEKRVAEYQKSGVMASLSKSGSKNSQESGSKGDSLNFDADF